MPKQEANAMVVVPVAVFEWIVNYAYTTFLVVRQSNLVSLRLPAARQ